MIRFVDIRGSETGNRFSWWDTNKNKYLEFDGEQAWETWDDFLFVCPDALEGRLKSLCPGWCQQRLIVNDISEYQAVILNTITEGVFDSLKSMVDNYYKSMFNPEDYSWYNCKGELFINDDDGETLFNCYYGGSVDGICAIFGIETEGV